VLVLVCVCYGVFNGTNHSTHETQAERMRIPSLKKKTMGYYVLILLQVQYEHFYDK